MSDAGIVNDSLERRGAKIKRRSQFRSAVAVANAELDEILTVSRDTSLLSWDISLVTNFMAKTISIEIKLASHVDHRF